MKVSVLVENTSINKAIQAGVGLSLFIEHKGVSVLYDVGPDNSIVNNADQMNIDLNHVDYVVLSHGHKDHTGGLSFVDCSKIYAHPKAKEPLFSKERNISMPLCNLIEVESELTIADGIHLLVNSSKRGFVPENSHLYRNGSLDDFSHELMLIIELESELILFSGCSHQGVTNMIYTAEKRYKKPVRITFGGMHLKDYEDLTDLEMLKDELLSMDTVFYTGHCTGDKAYEYLNEYLEGQLHRLSSGKEFEF